MTSGGCRGGGGNASAPNPTRWPLVSIEKGGNAEGNYGNGGGGAGLWLAAYAAVAKRIWGRGQRWEVNVKGKR